MRRLLSLATAIIAAVCMNAGALMAQVTNLEFTNAYFEDNTNITPSMWNKKNINFVAFTADRVYRANVKINTDRVAGTYTMADCDAYEVSVTKVATYDSYYATEGTFEVTQDGNSVTLVSDMTTDGGDFHITINYVKPEQVAVNMGGISIYDYSKPTYNISADNSNFSLSLSLTSTAADGSLADGEYSLGEWDNLYIKAFYASVYFTSDSKVTVTNTTSWNGDPCVKITGEVMGKNGQKYVLNITSGLSEPDNMFELNDAEATVTPDFRENQRWVLEGKSQDILVHLQMAKEDYVGVYDMKKWAFGYDNYMTVNGSDIEISQALITVEDLGESIHATGWVMGELNGQLYYVAVDLTGAKGSEPAAEGDCNTDVNVAFSDYTLASDWMWGGWILDATNADGYALHLTSNIYWDGTELISGNYIVTNDWEAELSVVPSTYMEGAGGDDWGPLRAPANGGTPNGSYVADANGNFWFIYKGTVKVNYVNGELNIVCDCVNTAGNKVQVALGQNAIATGINNVISNAPKAKKYILNGKVVIEKDGKVFGIDGK